jgi:hypothetical protein
MTGRAFRRIEAAFVGAAFAFASFSFPFFAFFLSVMHESSP